jgi:hypothetical protein
MSALLFVIGVSFADSVVSAAITFNVDTEDVILGRDFSLIIQGNDVPAITGGGLNLIFNPSVIKIKSVTINTSVFEDYSGDGTEEGILDNSSGLLADTTFKTRRGASGDFSIMIIDFTAVGSGTSLLKLSESTASSFLDTSGRPLGNQIVFSDAIIKVSTDHVPIEFWLVSAILLMLGVLLHFEVSSRQRLM